MSSRDFRTRPIIITDVETTGLDPYQDHHEIIDIGAIAVDHDLTEIARFSQKVLPDHIQTATPKALEVNGYDPALWADAISHKDAGTAFQKFSSGGILAAWNITFEFTFLQEMFRKLRINDLMDYHRIDIPSIAWMMIPELRYLSMDKVAEYFHLPPEPKPHIGLRGAAYELTILRRLRKRLA